MQFWKKGGIVQLEEGLYLGNSERRVVFVQFWKKDGICAIPEEGWYLCNSGRRAVFAQCSRKSGICAILKERYFEVNAASPFLLGISLPRSDMGKSRGEGCRGGRWERKEIRGG